MKLYLREPDFVTPRENFVLERADGELVHGDYVVAFYATEKDVENRLAEVLILGPTCKDLETGLPVADEMTFEGVKVVVVEDDGKLPGEE